MLKRHLPMKLASAALCFALGFGDARAADEPGYEMGSYIDGPGREVMAGELEAAIDAAAPHAGSRDSIRALIANTNLCVAHTLRRELSAAAAACDRAYELARDAGARRIGTVEAQTETAKALSNRGVLRALSGETADAASDFRNAARMNSGWGAARRNLAYIEDSGALEPRMARTD